MGTVDWLNSLKDKVIDAAMYDLLKRNFELLEQNNDQLKERVAFLKDEVDRLKLHNDRLAEENAVLKRELDGVKAAQQFTVKQGFVFKRNAEGKYDSEPYCPNCHRLLGSLNNRLYSCSLCGYATMGSGGPPWAVAEALNKQL